MELRVKGFRILVLGAAWWAAVESLASLGLPAFLAATPAPADPATAAAPLAPLRRFDAVPSAEELCETRGSRTEAFELLTPPECLIVPRVAEPATAARDCATMVFVEDLRCGTRGIWETMRRDYME